MTRAGFRDASVTRIRKRNPEMALYESDISAIR
jgi:hypothetical protein